MNDILVRYRWLIVAVFAVPLLAGIAYMVSERVRDPAPLEITASDLPATDIRIYITGAVQNPGVYPAHEGDRWIDALESAGGPTADSDLTRINLAQRIADEDLIVVPRNGETAVASASEPPLVNINTAAESELDTLPGIGEVRAHDIVQSRMAEGPFASPEDLLARKLVPESVYEDIAPLITIGP